MLTRKNRSIFKACLFAFLFTMPFHFALAQENSNLRLSEAIDLGTKNYQSLQAKQNYLNAASQLVKDAKTQYLPNLIASMQQSYGSINGQFGPSLAYGGYGVASAGPVSKSQNWDAAFGALYLVNMNWEVFTFGRIKSKLKVANASLKKDSADLLQEKFIHSVKVSGAYLNLLIAQKNVKNAEVNLQRALNIQQAVIVRTKAGLSAGVDSLSARAEISKAKLILLEAKNNEDLGLSQFAQLLNLSKSSFNLDTTFLSKLPLEFSTSMPMEQNPQVQYFHQRIEESNSITNYLKKSILPSINLFGIYQTRGSGFDSNYNASNNFSYSSNYFDGISPTRSNYVVGVAFAWNFLSPTKIKYQVNSQKYITEAYQNEYDQVSTQLKSQLALADQRIANSLQAISEVPTQYKAAEGAYLQKTVLYKNGLISIVDLQQSLYALSRAEADLSIAYINVWQALLLKAAASGDFDLFRKQLQ